MFNFTTLFKQHQTLKNNTTCSHLQSYNANNLKNKRENQTYDIYREYNY